MNFEEIRGLVKTKIDESNATKKAYNAAISKQESDIEKATESMNAAYDAADVKNYHKAQDAIRTAQDTKGMYEKKLKELTEKKLLSDEEYKSLCDSINNDITKANEETKKALRKLIKDIWRICAGYNQNVKDAATLLHDLQYEIMKDDCCMKSASGTKVFLQGNDLSYRMKNYFLSLSHYVDSITTELETEGRKNEPWFK